MDYLIQTNIASRIKTVSCSWIPMYSVYISTCFSSHFTKQWLDRPMTNMTYEHPDTNCLEIWTMAVLRYTILSYHQSVRNLKLQKKATDSSHVQYVLLGNQWHCESKGSCHENGAQSVYHLWIPTPTQLLDCLSDHQDHLYFDCLSFSLKQKIRTLSVASACKDFNPPTPNCNLNILYT